MATDATKPDGNFYVESAVVDSLADDMATGLVMLYRAPRQSGKTTDALAVCRRLRKDGIQVQHIMAASHVLLWQQSICITWQQAAFECHP